MEYGQRVRILSLPRERKGYPRYLVGLYGTVERAPSSDGARVGVMVEGYRNPYSSVGVFWFSQDDLEVYDEKDEKEEDSMLRDFNKVARVELDTTREGKDIIYCALYDDGTEYKIKDSVLVIYGGKESLGKIEDITTIGEPPFDIPTKISGVNSEIICKIDRSAYQTRVANRARVNELVKSMDKIIKEMDEVKKYEIYAKDNPALATMLEELKSLTS